MKKIQKLLSISIAMTMLLMTITGCSSDNSEQVSTSPTTDVEQNQTDEVVEEELVTDEDATEDEVAEEEATEEEVAEEEATEEEVAEEETTEEEATEEEVTEDEETQEVSGDFQQLAMPEAGETVATIKVANFGEIKLKFFQDKAPLAVENFVTHAQNGYYDGITFHRVINDFMIQGGDPTGTGAGGTSIWNEVFDNEDNTDLYHFNGALSMANAGKDTNGSQFFIVNSSKENPRSSMRSEYSDYAKEIYSSVGGVSSLDGGYTVFGQVYEGLDIVQAIMQVEKTGAQGSTPIDKVVIESVTITQYK